MVTAQLRADFLLHGCRSLKDKRSRLAKLRDKFGKQTAIAVCESAFADVLSQSQWTFVVCASDARVVEQSMADIERYLSTNVDAEVTQLRRSWLNE